MSYAEIKSTINSDLSTPLNVLASNLFTEGRQSSKIFTSNGTFTVPEGVTHIMVSAIAAGGKGGTSTSIIGSSYWCGGGGGSGNAVIDRVLPVTSGESIGITVGNGNTLIGSYITLIAGNPGGNGTATSGNNSPFYGGVGGSGGAGGGGGCARSTITSAGVVGGNGGKGNYFGNGEAGNGFAGNSNTASWSVFTGIGGGQFNHGSQGLTGGGYPNGGGGGGGIAYFGYGGDGASLGNVIGLNGIGYGSGGGGGYPGGNGAPGIVIIKW